MKYKLIVLGGFLLAILLCGAPALASKQLTVQVNGSAVSVPPGTHVVEGQVMVPIRWAAEQLGAYSIDWDPDTRDITIKTNEDLYKIVRFSCYLWGLEYRSADREVVPLADRAGNLSLPHIIGNDRELVLNLDSWKEKYSNGFLPPPGSSICITVINDNQPYPSGYVVNCYEDYNGHFYVPMDWLELLFYADVNYDKDTNLLSIQSPDEKEIEKQIAMIEDVLIPATPEEAVQLWGRGEQIRNGALQYTVLSPELRLQADKRIHQSGWITGYSSPWVGPITVKEERKLDASAVEYTVTFPEITSSPPAPTATEKFVVRKLTVDGKEGWFITEMLQSSGYGLI